MTIWGILDLRPAVAGLYSRRRGARTMSVLYKALQKAEKDNAQRQAAQPALESERVAGSGVGRAAASGRVNWRMAGAGLAIVFVAVMGSAWYFTSGEFSQPALQTVKLESRPAVPPVMAHPAQSVPGAPAPVSPAPASVEPAVASAEPAVPAAPNTQSPAPATEEKTVAQVAPTEPVAAPQAPEAVTQSPPPNTAAPAPKVREAKNAAPPTSKPDRAPSAQIAADSPAQMLRPPISVKREQFGLSGVGNAVQVRQVSEGARNNVNAGYDALIRSDYTAAVNFYDAALKGEPTSVLALLGRGTALQKLGKKDEARQSYDAALRIDPPNREALTNLTGLLADTQPGEALKRLLELEKEYPNFSPIVAQIGLAYAKMDNLQAALDYLRRATAITPGVALYQFNLAILLDRMKLPQQALDSYKQVLLLTDGRPAPEIPRNEIERRVRFLSTQ